MKKINYNNFFKFLFLILQLLQIGIASEIFENCEKAIKLTYPNLDSIKHDVWEIPIEVINVIEKKSRQRFFKPNLHIWEIYNDSSMIGIAILDNVIGKSMPISFLVLFDNYGKIRRTINLSPRNNIFCRNLTTNFSITFNLPAKLHIICRK